MANRVSNEQLEELLEFLAEHPNLAKGVGLGARSKETIDKKWNELATKLNSFGSGSSKTGERWKKYWADIKHKSKTRLAKRRQDALGTGGGPEEDLSEIDKKVLTIIGKNAVYGDVQHRAPVSSVTPEMPVCTPAVQPGNIVVSEEVVISGLQTRVELEWVMELKRNRVRAENKLADAAYMIAEAANKIAEASLINAETSRKQLEVLNVVVEVVRQLSSVLAARDSH